jgi:phosphoenolpyruvate---glycerone phosphotransferase subunit DhaL
MSVDAQTVRNWLAHAASDLQAAKGYLTELDAAIGDADHGVNIARGFSAVVDKVNQAGAQTEDVGALFKLVGMTLMSTVGGASGMLYGNFFLQAARVAQGKGELTDTELLAAMQTGLDGIVQRGRAVVGDKTMVDAWMPAVAALAQALHSGASLPHALYDCVASAETGMNSTIPLVAKKGRASYLGERSAGHLDPGAASTTILLRALCSVVDPENSSS